MIGPTVHCKLWPFCGGIAPLDKSEELHQVPVLVSPGKKSSVHIVYERGGGFAVPTELLLVVHICWDVSCFEHSEDYVARI